MKKKNWNLPAILTCVSAFIAIIALAIAYLSCTDEGFGMPEMPLLTGLTVAAVVLAGAIITLSAKKGDSILNSVMLVGMVVVLGISVYTMVQGKTQVFGTTIFSDLERDFEPAMRAAKLGIVSIAAYLAAAVIGCICSFFSFRKA